MIELKVFLLRHGMTQGDLASATGLSEKTISNAVTGRHAPSFHTSRTILDFCRKLDPTVTHEQLFGTVAA